MFHVFYYISTVLFIAFYFNDFKFNYFIIFDRVCIGAKSTQMCESRLLTRGGVFNLAKTLVPQESHLFLRGPLTPTSSWSDSGYPAFNFYRRDE